MLQQCIRLCDSSLFVLTPRNDFLSCCAEELNWPAQNPDLTPTPNSQHQCPTSLNAPVAEWEQSPTARFQNLVESFPRRVEAVIAADECSWL